MAECRRPSTVTASTRVPSVPLPVARSGWSERRPVVMPPVSVLCPVKKRLRGYLSLAGSVDPGLREGAEIHRPPPPPCYFRVRGRCGCGRRNRAVADCRVRLAEPEQAERQRPVTGVAFLQNVAETTSSPTGFPRPRRWMLVPWLLAPTIPCFLILNMDGNQPMRFSIACQSAIPIIGRMPVVGQGRPTFSAISPVPGFSPWQIRRVSDHGRSFGSVGSPMNLRLLCM